MRAQHFVPLLIVSQKADSEHWVLFLDVQVISQSWLLRVRKTLDDALSGRLVKWSLDHELMESPDIYSNATCPVHYTRQDLEDANEALHRLQGIHLFPVRDNADHHPSSARLRDATGRTP